MNPNECRGCGEVHEAKTVAILVNIDSGQTVSASFSGDTAFTDATEYADGLASVYPYNDDNAWQAMVVGNGPAETQAKASLDAAINECASDLITALTEWIDDVASRN